MPKKVLGHLISENKLQMAIALSPGKVRTEIRAMLLDELWKQLRIFLAISIVLLLCVIFWPTGAKEDTITIARPEGTAQGMIREFLVESVDGWAEISLEVHARDYSEEELSQLHEAAVEYLDQTVLGENEAWNQIESNLVFPELVSGQFPVQWSTDAPWLVSGNGEVQNETLSRENRVSIRAEITYGTEFRVYERQITVVPKTYTQEELKIKEIETELQRLEEESRLSDLVSVPGTILGREVKDAEEDTVTIRFFCLAVAIILPVLGYYAYFEQLDKKRKTRLKQAARAYTEFVTKLTLTLMAGVSVRQTMERLAREYAKTYGADYVLTQELRVTRQELENGRPEQEVYESFGNRIGLVSYQRVAALLGQSVSRGVQDIRSLLLAEVKEVTVQERADIRIRGEQAGSKLLLPMMGFLVIIFAILLVPAFRMF